MQHDLEVLGEQVLKKAGDMVVEIAIGEVEPDLFYAEVVKRRDDGVVGGRVRVGGHADATEAFGHTVPHWGQVATRH
ncbi:hypothetical protein [Azoarcus taiwanensis]|uniref:Uncharacterized protein n=1 Tax=Azoarcus taiwanensis TaxID=666964 RepID=A0A972F7Y4_9RHOO|nr:hypothetical protein [Azoarcus taiwanensis]NMG03095.1 hypothetical protein [Azoarcus taiwanensis]